MKFMVWKTRHGPSSRMSFSHCWGPTIYNSTFSLFKAARNVRIWHMLQRRHTYATKHDTTSSLMLYSYSPLLLQRKHQYTLWPNKIWKHRSSLMKPPLFDLHWSTCLCHLDFSAWNKHCSLVFLILQRTLVSVFE